MKHHGSARKHVFEGHPRLSLGAGLDVTQKAGDDLDEGDTLFQNLAGFVHEGRAKHPLERPHEPPLDPVKQRLVGRIADKGFLGVEIKKNVVGRVVWPPSIATSTG